MLKSILIYGGILAAVFVLRFALVAVVTKLEEKLKEQNSASPFWIPFFLSLLSFLGCALIIAQFAVPVLWFVSRWQKVSAVLLTIAILSAVAFGTRMSFAALSDMTQYGTKKRLHIITAIVYFLYIDWPLNAACVAIVTGFDLPEMVRMTLNLSLFTVYVVYLIILLVRSLKSFSE